MKKQLYLITSLLLLLYSCDPFPSVFNVTTKNFGENAVISIISAETGETLKVENIKNNDQTFKINIPKKGYTILTTEDGRKKRDYYFYLDKGNYQCILDANHYNAYPFKNVPTAEGEEFIAFYKLKDVMSKNILDSVDYATNQLDEANPNNVAERAKLVDVWMEKKILLDLEMIRAFAKKAPHSQHTLFLLEQLGRVDADPKTYLSIINLLSSEVRESKRGKDLLSQTSQANQMMAGSKMPNIEGESPDGEPFNYKLLKKANLVICWTSYSLKSRKNNQVLTDLYEKYKGKDVEFIGVSFDKKRDWWINVIKDDKLIWPQFSDLKGAKSPNAKNLSNYNITYFFLVDQNGTVLTNNDLSLDFVSDEISKNLKNK